MKATVTRCRAKSGPDGTPGRLRTEKGFECDTLELPWKDNQSGVSCILPDTYTAWLWYSDHLGRMVVRLEDKHGREDCLIHNANFAGDASTGRVTQIHGCTAVGHGYAQIDRPDGKGKQFGILFSKDTLSALVSHLGAGPHEITYQWDDSTGS